MTEVQRFRSMVAGVLRACLEHAEALDDEASINALHDALDVVDPPKPIADVGESFENFMDREKPKHQR